MKLLRKTSESGDELSQKGPNWLKISVIANIVILVVALGTLAGFEVIHQSDTNPNLCRLCHVMKSHVDSYLTSGNLDSIHEQAGVECKDCHDYPVQAEIASAVKFITGNYAVYANGELSKRSYDDTMCTKCHISLEHVAELTDDLGRNPHAGHWGPLPCKTCHVSHGEQINYCGQCHDNGGQRMIGQ